MLRECFFHKERSYRWSLRWLKEWLQKAVLEEPMVRSSVKWIVCRSNSIGDPLVCYENACLIRRGVIGGQRAGLKSGCKKWLLKSL